jgi:hypothetical protein
MQSCERNSSSYCGVLSFSSYLKLLFLLIFTESICPYSFSSFTLRFLFSELNHFYLDSPSLTIWHDLICISTFHCTSHLVEKCYHFLKQGAEKQLKHAVGTMRPVSVAFEVISDFRLYNGGVYTSSECHSGPQVNSYFK